MLMRGFREFLGKLLHAFGVIKLHDDSKHFSFSRPWYFTSDYYCCVWRRCAGDERARVMHEKAGVSPGSVTGSVEHIIKQP